MDCRQPVELLVGPRVSSASGIGRSSSSTSTSSSSELVTRAGNGAGGGAGAALAFFAGGALDGGPCGDRGRLTDALGGAAGSGGRSSVDLLVGLALADPEPGPSPVISSTLMNFLSWHSHADGLHRKLVQLYAE